MFFFVHLFFSGVLVFFYQVPEKVCYKIVCSGMYVCMCVYVCVGSIYVEYLRVSV